MPKKKNIHDRPRSTNDPLGKLIQLYRPNTATILMTFILLLAGGVGVTIYCLLQESFPWKVMLAGLFMLLAAPVLLVINLFNFGRSLEIRKHGIRYREGGGIETELAWDEIVDVEVERTEMHNAGPIWMYSKRPGIKGPRSPLAKTEWDEMVTPTGTATIPADS